MLPSGDSEYDDVKFGSSGTTNALGRTALQCAVQGKPLHVELTLPCLGILYLKPEGAIDGEGSKLGIAKYQPEPIMDSALFSKTQYGETGF